MTDTVAASDIHPDVAGLAQDIVDEVELLVADVETLDATKWLVHADKIDTLNQQLQALLIPHPPTDDTPTTKTSTKK